MCVFERERWSMCVCERERESVREKEKNTKPDRKNNKNDLKIYKKKVYIPISTTVAVLSS